MTDLDLDLLPDGGVVFRQWALQQSPITDLIEQRISPKLSGKATQIRFSVASDGAGSYGEGAPLILVECWGPGDQASDEGEASQLARTVAAVVDHHPDAGLESGPYSSPDPTSNRPRWILTVRLYTFTDS